MENDLSKDGRDVVNVGFYKEKLYRKVDTKSDIIVRSMKFSGARSGKVIMVGFDEFSIRESDGNNIVIKFDDILDLE